MHGRHGHARHSILWSVADPGGGQIRPWPPPSKLAMEFGPLSGAGRVMMAL